MLAQEICSLRAKYDFNLLTKLNKPTGAQLDAGIYTIGSDGDFATIQDAFNKLGTDGVAGNVTLELVDELYIAPIDSFRCHLGRPIPGAGPDNRDTIKTVKNKNVTIEGSGIYFYELKADDYIATKKMIE